MSKNFELLAQIETDIGSVPAVQDRSAERAATPAPSLTALNGSHVDHEIATLVQRVFLPVVGAPDRQVVFCGIEPENASSSICARTARSLAALTSERVCLVDANSSQAGLMGLFGVSPAEDAYISGKPSAQCVAIAGDLWLAQYRVRPGDGEPRTGGDLQSILTELKRDFGYVLIDAPGCTLNDDAVMLGQLSDAAILVVEAETTHRLKASKAKQNFEAAGVRLAGAVLYNRSFPVPKALYERL